jgi:hypothetical protein
LLKRLPQNTVLRNRQENTVTSLVKTYTEMYPMIGSRKPNQTDIIRRALQVLVVHNEAIWSCNGIVPVSFEQYLQ